jgi:C-terminal processing protease CtpA/Prc
MGEYDGKTPQEFADAIGRTLRNASHDKHFAVFYQPAPAVSPEAATQTVEPRERLNFGFGKLERLRGNVGYLELVNFSDLRQQSAETASTWLSTLANFDAIILDLRKNGGGHGPMMAFIATYFFAPTPVHLSDIHWRDTNETNQFWTAAFVPGQRSARQPLYILTSASTFSGAEDFCYSLQNLKRALVVGETTGGGAHSSRGPQRLTPSFTALIPADITDYQNKLGRDRCHARYQDVSGRFTGRGAPPCTEVPPGKGNGPAVEANVAAGRR